MTRLHASDPITHRYTDMRLYPRFTEFIPAALSSVPQSRILHLATQKTWELSEVSEILDLDAYCILTLIDTGHVIEEGGDGGPILTDSILYFRPDAMTRYHASSFPNRSGNRCPLNGFYYTEKPKTTGDRILESAVKHAFSAVAEDRGFMLDGWHPNGISIHPSFTCQASRRGQGWVVNIGVY